MRPRLLFKSLSSKLPLSLGEGWGEGLASNRTTPIFSFLSSLRFAQILRPHITQPALSGRKRTSFARSSGLVKSFSLDARKPSPWPSPRWRGNKKTAHRLFLGALFMVLWLIVGSSATLAQTTGFTYQGRLTDGGTAANGNYDLQFALFDSLSGGTQVGSTQTLNTVAVSNGVFTVSLDFGANAFPGASRFLEIGARPAGSGSFTPLTPRQPITSTPYAVRSLNAASADSVPASGVPPGSGNYIQNATSPQSSSNFNISGNGTAGGTLSGNLVNATTQYNLNGSRILSNAGTGNLFAGLNAGAANTSGFRNTIIGSGAGLTQTNASENTFIGFEAGKVNTVGVNTFVGTRAGLSNTMGGANAFFGAAAGITNTEGGRNAFFGFQAGLTNSTGNNNTLIGSNADVGSGNLTNATAIGAEAQVGASNALVLGGITGVGFGTDTNVGIGTTAPTAKLSVIATGADARVLHLGIERAWVFKQLGTGAATALELTGDDPNNNNKNFIINTAGNVGIGTTSPTATLSVNGTANKPGAGSWDNFSDERLKKIKGRFTSGLKTVLQLQPLRYEYKADNALGLNSSGEHIGFSAQALQKIIPEAVTKNDKGYLLVNNDPILWTMLNSIKEQQTQIEQQRELIERQQALAIRQQQQLDALKKLACRSHRRAAVCK